MHSECHHRRKTINIHGKNNIFNSIFSFLFFFLIIISAVFVLSTLPKVFYLFIFNQQKMNGLTNLTFFFSFCSFSLFKFFNCNFAYDFTGWALELPIIHSLTFIHFFLLFSVMEINTLLLSLYRIFHIIILSTFVLLYIFFF